MIGDTHFLRLLIVNQTFCLFAFLLLVNPLTNAESSLALFITNPFWRITMTISNRLNKHFALAAVATAAVAATSNAAIVYSGTVSVEVHPALAEGAYIADSLYVFLISPDDGAGSSAIITVFSQNTGIFIPLSQAADPINPRNFARGDTIGTLTGVLKMNYPTLIMYDFATGQGPFLPQQTGYVGIGFGSGTQFNYGWIEFTVYEQGSQKSMVMTGWAYNDVVNESITVGQIPAPGAFALLAMGGLVARRRRLS
ncbi:MAG: hypothetical protein WCK93_13315 [Nitrosomonadales bacterium]